LWYHLFCHKQQKLCWRYFAIQTVSSIVRT